MGIKGLLPFVKNACRDGNISEFHGKTIAIDVSCYLHKGIVGCMHEISQGKETDFYVYYVLKYIKLLLSHNCKVIMVFDGRPLPAKKEVNDQRRERREENRKLAVQLMKDGKTEEAHKMFRMTSSITAEMVEKTIVAAKQLDKVDVVVAPYEADAQLAFLTNAGFAHAVVTEDSDLIVFGCERIIFKINDSGPCTIFEKSKLEKCVSKPLQQDFSFETFRRVCILAGCDYLQKGLPGVGLAKAETFFSKASNPDMKITLPRIPAYLKMPKLKKEVTREFVNDFLRAEKTFKFQIVFDPRERCQKPLNPYSLDEIDGEEEEDDDFMSNNSQDNDFKFAGIVLMPREAIRLALGNKFENLSKPSIQDKFILSKLPSWSIWNSEKHDNMPDEETTDANTFTAFISTSVMRKVEKVATPEPSRKRIRVDEEEAELRAKKIAILKPKNAAITPWNADELMRIYGGGAAGSSSDSNTPEKKVEVEQEPEREPPEPIEKPTKLDSFTSPKCSPYFSKGHFTGPRLKLGCLTKVKLKPLHKALDRTTLLDGSLEKEKENVTDSLDLENEEKEPEKVPIIASQSPSNPFAYRASGLRRSAKK